MGVFDQNELDAAAQAAATENTAADAAVNAPAPEQAPEADKAPEAPKAEKPKAPAKEKAPEAPEAKAPEAPKAAAKAAEPKVKKLAYKEGEKPSNEDVKTPQDMRDYLMSFPKVKTLIPLMPGEKPGTMEIIAINGVQLNVKKGVMVDLPKPFADLVFAHYNISLENGTLGADKRIDGNKTKEDALS